MGKETNFPGVPFEERKKVEKMVWSESTPSNNGGAPRKTGAEPGHGDNVARTDVAGSDRLVQGKRNRRGAGVAIVGQVGDDLV